MKRNRLLKTGILFVFFVFVCSSINPVSAAELDIAVIAVSSDPATVNQILSVTVTRTADGSPVEGALVQYILNHGTPINTFTDASGISSFKPQLTGTLDIIVTKAEEGLSGKRTVDVVDKADTTTTTASGGGGGGGAGGGARLALTQSPTPTSVTPTPLVTPTPPAVTPNPTPTPIQIQIPPASVPVIRLFIIVAIIAAVMSVAVVYTVLRRR
ncbi:MAG: hypothetical protein WBC40_03700 [Halobacteriota archaeon]